MHLEFKVKINYLVLDVKLLLINMNNVENSFFKKVYRYKKFDKTFYTDWCSKLIVVSERVMLIVDLDEN